MEECFCNEPGFCQFFNKEMTADPPSWQWCQSATSEERKAYKERSDLGLQTKRRRSPSGKIITLDALINTTKAKLIPQLKKYNISGIVGVPRSGLITASIIAVELNLPLYSFNGKELVLLSSFSEYGGCRMEHFNQSGDCLLFIDDTSSSGFAAKNIKELFPESIFAVTYSTPVGTKHVDHYGEILENPHILEWNFFNSLHVQHALFDIDGIFCKNVPIEILNDEEKEIAWLETVEPYLERIPKLFKAKALVTGRLERYRDVTEAWLKRHGFNYNKLIMFPTEREEERNLKHHFVVGQYKGEIAKKMFAKFFVESEMPEAKIIKETFPNTCVICPNDGVYF